MALTRKAFLVQMVGSGWALASCGGGGSSSPPAPPPAPAGGACGVSISDNHGHVLTVLLTDLDSPADKTYDIQGTAAHTHSVTFTVAELAMLKAGQVVTKSSSVTLGHDHSIAERCA
ncbi:MAG: hypothetical protein OEU94_06125 [Aquincola sp.]|nr:hypothetical protein [Aquincola sp.]